MLTGQRIKNSLMLPQDLASQFSERSQLKEYLDLRDLRRIRVTNSSLSYKPLQWNLMPISTLNQVMSFTKMQRLVNGSNSGKHLLLYYSECLQVSTCSKFIKEMALHRFNGCLKIGIGSTFLVNSKMEVDGILQDIDTVTITII